MGVKALCAYKGSLQGRGEFELGSLSLPSALCRLEELLMGAGFQ